MTDLLTFISKIIADVPPYYAELVVIGVADASDERVTRDTELFMDDERFRVFDLRGAQDVRGIGALATDIGDTIRVLLVDNNTATNWLDRLTRSFLDKKGSDRIQGRLGRAPEGAEHHRDVLRRNKHHTPARSTPRADRAVRQVIIQY